MYHRTKHLKLMRLVAFCKFLVPYNHHLWVSGQEGTLEILLPHRGVEGTLGGW